MLEGKEREAGRRGGQSSGRWPSIKIQFVPFIMYSVRREGKGGGGEGQSSGRWPSLNIQFIPLIMYSVRREGKVRRKGQGGGGSIEWALALSKHSIHTIYYV